MSENSSSKQLFKGQTTHPLSQEEKAALFKKCRLISPDENSNQQFSDTINLLNQTPTGSQFLRQMLEADDVFRFNMKGNPSLLAIGSYSPMTDKINFHGNITNDPSQMAINLAHETTHDLQISNLKFIAKSFLGDNPSRVLLDSETQALNQQLAYELNIYSTSNFQYDLIVEKNKTEGMSSVKAREAAFNFITEPDYEYSKVYIASYKMWRKYADNPETTPKDCLVYQPMPGVDPEEAKVAYAHQMASYHTRAIFAKDFVAHAYPETSNEGATHFNAEMTMEFAKSYRKQDCDKVTVPFKMVEEIKKRNPLIRQPDYNPIRKANGQPEVKYASSVNQENKEATLSSVTNQEAMTPTTPEQSAASEAVIQPPQTALAQAEAPLQSPQTSLTNNDSSLEAQEANAPHLSKNSMAATLLSHGQNISQENDINPITLQQMNGERTA